MIEWLQRLYLPVLSCPDFAQVTTDFYELGVPLALLPLLPRQNLVDLSQQEQGALAIEFRRNGWFLSN
jgi:hypothetical protein